jgi:TonB family protein
MKTSSGTLLCFFLALASPSAWAANYHVYKKFDAISHSNQLKPCRHHGCTCAPMDRAGNAACKKSLAPRISGAIAFADWIDPEPGAHRPSEPSIVPRVAQTDTAKPNVPATSTKKSAPAPVAAAVGKWHKALAARLARYNRYPAQGNSAEGLVSVAFTIDRKGKVLSSRIEKTSGSTVLDAEALALLARAAPFPAPPPEVTDAELTFVVPVHFTAGEKH